MFEFNVTVYKIDETTFPYGKYNYVSRYINDKVYNDIYKWSKVIHETQSAQISQK